VPRWVLSEVDLDVLVELTRSPDLPYPLQLGSPGVTFDERRRHVEGARTGLVARGLVDGLDPVADLRHALSLLTSGELVLDGRIASARLVGVVRGDEAVLAVQTGETVRLSLMPDQLLVSMITEWLPPVPRRAGNSTAVPREAVMRALTAVAESGDHGELGRVLVEAGIREPDVRTLTELVRGKGVAAQFGIARRSAATDTYRERRVWSWYATRAGGLLMSCDTADPWASLVPADPARVAEYLGDALYELRYGPGKVLETPYVV